MSDLLDTTIDAGRIQVQLLSAGVHLSESDSGLIPFRVELVPRSRSEANRFAAALRLASKRMDEIAKEMR